MKSHLSCLAADGINVERLLTRLGRDYVTTVDAVSVVRIIVL